jgi:hypothetical protein
MRQNGRRCPETLMHDKRPGGLTALAVINFVFTGLNVLGIGGMVTMLLVGQSDQPELAQLATMVEEFRGLFIASIILTAVSSVLLLVAGIGYLRQKRVMGRIVGSAYAVIAIVSAFISATVLPAEMGGGIGIGTVFGLLYPVLTLVLVNITFKDDLVH